MSLVENAVRPGRPSRQWKHDQLLRLRKCVEDGMLTMGEITSRFHCGTDEIHKLVKLLGWNNPRSERTTPKGERPSLSRAGRTRQGGGGSNPPDNHATVQPSVGASPRGLSETEYELLTEDINYLRRTGFVVFQSQGLIMVGNKLCTPDQVQTIAARERRLRTKP